MGLRILVIKPGRIVRFFDTAYRGHLWAGFHGLDAALTPGVGRSGQFPAYTV